MIQWLRENKYAAMLLTLVRLYLGWKWLTAGWNKISAEKTFDASGFVQGAIAKPVMASGTSEPMYPNFVAFLENFALPNIELFNVLVSWGEFLVGAGLIVGCLAPAAAFFGLLMNFMYMFAGALSSNPWMILLGGIVLMAGVNSGKFGVDYVLFPRLRRLFGQQPGAEVDQLKKPA